MSAKGKCLVVGDVDQRYLDRLTQVGYEIIHKSDEYELKGEVFEACIIHEYLTGTTAQHELNLANAQLMGNDDWYHDIEPVYIQAPENLPEIKITIERKKPHTQQFWTNNWRKK